MRTSSNGNIFRVAGRLWGESTSHWGIPLTKASDAELWCFFDLRLKKHWANNRDAGNLRRHFDVNVMIICKNYDYINTRGKDFVLSHWNFRLYVKVELFVCFMFNCIWYMLWHLTTCPMWYRMMIWWSLKKDKILPKILGGGEGIIMTGSSFSHNNIQCNGLQQNFRI